MAGGDFDQAATAAQHLGQYAEHVQTAVVADPAATVAAYCAAVGIPFSKPALRWAPGARDEWRQSARWHTRVSESTGFTQSPTSYETTTANNAMLARYSAHHEPFYRALRATRSQFPS